MLFLQIINKTPCDTCWFNECRYWEQCRGANLKKVENPELDLIKQDIKRFLFENDLNRPRVIDNNTETMG